MHVISEVSAKEKEVAASAEVEAKDLLAATKKVPTKRSPTTTSASMHMSRASLQGKILQLEARVRSAMEDVDNKTNATLHLWKALRSV